MSAKYTATRIEGGAESYRIMLELGDTEQILGLLALRDDVTQADAMTLIEGILGYLNKDLQEEPQMSVDFASGDVSFTIGTTIPVKQVESVSPPTKLPLEFLFGGAFQPVKHSPHDGPVCHKCIFNESPLCEQAQCYSWEREDKNNVYFVALGSEDVKGAYKSKSKVFKVSD